MKTRKTFNTSWMKKFFCFLLAFAMIFSNVTMAQVEASTETITYPAVKEYTTSSGEFSLTDSSRFVIVSNAQSLQNEILENDLKLLSSEFNAVGLTNNSMNIIYGSDSTAVAGDIVIQLNTASSNISPEAYTIAIGETAKVSATGEAGIFYGIRTIEKALRLNNGKMNQGTINDEPAVEVRGFHLDNARKMFTKDWVLALIKDLSYQNFNTLQFHFSENEGYRLESDTLEAIEGWSYPSDGYFTKEDMLDIIAECQKYHIELVPSLDSPGHMSYVLNFLPDDWDCSSIWSESTDFRSVQTFNIFQKQECKDFLKDLFTEYAEFFSAAGCKYMNIGGDEFLNQFSRMTNDQYITVMNYFNDIAALVKSYGLTPRAWNDGLMFGNYTGYTLDSDIEICYWSGPTGTAPISKFTANGNKVINMSDAKMYYVLGQWWMSAANPDGQTIFNTWDPGKLPGSADYGDQTITYPYNDSLLGASFAVWCDTPSMLSQSQISTNIFMRTRATAQKCWNPTATLTYSELESRCNTLGNAPGYTGTALPAPGDILYEGNFGTLTLRYVDTEGNSLKEDVTTYDVIGNSYSITPEDIYGYRFVSMDKDATGVYTEEEIIITLTYEIYIDKEGLREAVNNAATEGNYIPATYADYKTALENAKVVLGDTKASQTQVDEALSALRDAQADLILLDRTDLYLETTYPVAAAGYTSASYTTYQNALTAAETVLSNPDATEAAVSEALNNVLTAKSALALASTGDLITLSSTDEDYSWVGNYALKNAMDNNTLTFAWLADAQNVGDVLTCTFAKPVTLNSFRYQAPSGAGLDIFQDAVVEISNDGSNWTQIGTLKAEIDKTIAAGGQTVSYVRIRVVANSEYWVKIAEISLDYIENDTVDKSALETAISAAEALTESEYTAASWTVLQSALAKAEVVFADNSATAGEITATLTALNASIEALQEAPEPEPEPEPTTPVTDIFEDVSENDWFADEVQYVYDKGIMTGTTETTFEPNTAVTRATIVQTLYKLEGKPAVDDFEKYNSLNDTPDNIWWKNALAWALNTGVAKGDTTNNVFNPDDEVTREDLATFIYRYATKMGICEEFEGNVDAILGDTFVNSWAETAFAWAIDTGLIKGKTMNGASDLAPQAGATRAELATIMMRFYQNNHI